MYLNAKNQRKFALLCASTSCCPKSHFNIGTTWSSTCQEQCCVHLPQFITPPCTGKSLLSFDCWKILFSRMDLLLWLRENLQFPDSSLDYVFTEWMPGCPCGQHSHLFWLNWPCVTWLRRGVNANRRWCPRCTCAVGSPIIDLHVLHHSCPVSKFWNVFREFCVNSSTPRQAFFPDKFDTLFEVCMICYCWPNHAGGQSKFVIFFHTRLFWEWVCVCVRERERERERETETERERERERQRQRLRERGTNFWQCCCSGFFLCNWSHSS